jgi:hypothetical protein
VKEKLSIYIKPVERDMKVGKWEGNDEECRGKDWE